MDADMQLGRLEALNWVNVSVVQRKQAYWFDKKVLQLKRAWKADENDTILLSDCAYSWKSIKSGSV